MERIASPSFTNRLIHEFMLLLDGLVSSVPGRTGQLLRHRYYALRLKRLGRMGFGAIDSGMRFDSPENIAIGDNFIALRNCFVGAGGGGLVEIGGNVTLNSNVCIDAGEQGVIRIGDESGIAQNCVLRASSHRYDDPARPWKSQGHKPGSIIVEEDVWIAANCTLLPGAHVERGSIVASGSVVGGRVKAFSVVAGNPARVIGRRG